MGKFGQISTESRTLIDNRNSFSLPIFGIPLLIVLVSIVSTELWPLTDFRNWFSLSISGISLPIFFKLCMRIDIGKKCLGIADG